MKRKINIRNSYLTVSLSVAIIIMIAGFFSGTAWLGIDTEGDISFTGGFLLLICMIFLFLIGMLAGGWVWIVAGRFLFGINRKDIEYLLFKNQPEVPYIMAYNRWSVDKVFGAKQR